MKNIVLYIMCVLALASCCDGKKTEYTYKITYLDGTTETIIREHELRFIGDADCIGVCNCTNTERFCGVRKLNLISTRVIEPKKNENKSRNDFD